jgi:hypothetical protein
LSRAKQRLTNRKPPPALAGCRVEQYANRDRSMKYSGHSYLFRDGKEVGPVPRLAICRGDDNEVLLFHCDRRWNVLGMAGGYPNVKAAKRRAERTYSGISAAWVKTGFTRRQLKRYLDRLGHNVKCAFCGKAWHQVERMVRKGKSAICDACVRELSEIIAADSEQPVVATV